MTKEASQLREKGGKDVAGFINVNKRVLLVGIVVYGHLEAPALKGPYTWYLTNVDIHFHLKSVFLNPFSLVIQ